LQVFDLSPALVGPSAIMLVGSLMGTRCMVRIRKLAARDYRAVKKMERIIVDE